MGDSGRDIEAEQAFTENTQYAFRRVVELEAEVASLRAIVDRLPKTADGVPMFPGDAVWCQKSPSSTEVVSAVVSPYSKWTTSVWGEENTPHIAMKSGAGWHGSCYAYSTREAAEAAHRAQEIHDD